MDTELAQLEAQLEQLISQHDRLRADNGALRGRIARLEAELVAARSIARALAGVPMPIVSPSEIS